MKPLEPEYKPLAVEERVRQWWSQRGVKERVFSLNRGKPLFRFLEGPPTANGFMHVGHARGRTMKDVVLRYKTMAGFDVWRRAGWDCQGLPVEIEVEKKLGLASKRDIERVGMERFVEECNRLVDYYIGHWRETSERLAVWLDYDNAYETRRDGYIEFVWWTIKRAHEKGLIKEDYRVVPFCPRCETSLSSHEVSQGYATVKDPSIYVKFPVAGRDHEYILIWTTTPWTLPGNEAVTVHPDFDYVKVKVGGEVWILAKDAVERVLGGLGVQRYEILETVRGEGLRGLKYVHPLLEETPAHRGHDEPFSHAVVCGSHVSAEEGTGCVHTAPGHGPEDFEMGKSFGLRVFCPVDPRGHYTAEAGKYAGKFVKDADAEVIGDLRRKGLLAFAGEVEHEYPLCWRCESPLLYRADRQWFIRVQPMREKLLGENEMVEWIPEWAGKNRFGEWLANAEDWCISRSRVWGSPLNVWRCEGCGNLEVVGSLEELKRAAVTLPGRLELHRPWIDEVKVRCSRCGGTALRVPFVLDCWLDSGVAHAASVECLKDRGALGALYPYDLITEAIDQTRGWFYSLLVTGVLLFERAPYRRVLCQGHVLDKYFQKMSKSRGNVVWAEELLRRHGADLLRVYLLWKASPEDSLAFDEDEIVQLRRSLTVIWNVYLFAASYMELDCFNPSEWSYGKVKGHLRFEDRWLLARLQSAIAEATRLLDELKLSKALRAVLHLLVEDVSRLYIRLIRRRTWIEAPEMDKIAAYWTLHQALREASKLLAPFAPHLAEALFQSVAEGEESVHVQGWPSPDERLVDEEIQRRMEIGRETVRAASTARQKRQLKLRWPLPEATVVPADEAVKEALEAQLDLLKSQLNVKAFRVLAPGANPGFLSVSVEPNYRALGGKFKEKTRQIVEALKRLNPAEVAGALSSRGFVEVDVGVESFRLTAAEVAVRYHAPEHIVVQAFPHGTIYLDASRRRDLLAEALAKEFVRRAQVMRKEMRLRIEDFVSLTARVESEETAALLNEMADYIRQEVRAKNLRIVAAGEWTPESGAFVREWEVEDERITMGMRRL